jgi:DNA ligase (NAD+)
MDKIERIKELVELLSKASDAYYVNDNPIMSDKEYDSMYDELETLEKETGYILSASVTQKVQGKVLDGFQKVTHSKPMLSAAKTKDINEIKKFIGSNYFYCSYKLDGLTLVCIYENGEFKQAITRGTGVVGEDVTEQAKMIENLPMTIPYTGYLELRGECVVSWKNFHKINEGLAEPYSHPRNLAAGSLRNLDTNITKQRHLSYIVFECVSDLYDEESPYDDSKFDSKWDELGYLDYLGFTTVERRHGAVEDCIDDMPPDMYGFPVDGLIFEMCMKEYSKSLASTSHHEGCRMALKWADSTYETVLRDVIWDVGRSGVISPVAVFDGVDLDGALTTKATLHNLSIIESLELGIGDTITVYRSNMVIPKIDDNLTRSNTLVIPDTCQCCGSKAEIKYTDNSKFLMCTNPNCSAKSLAKFTHFVSRNCANIDGLSEKTLEALISRGFLHTFKDIYHLCEHHNELIQIDGLGEKSVTTLRKSIEKSRDIKLENFIAALGVPNIGLSAAKTISKHFNGSEEEFMIAYESDFDWTILDDFGVIMANSLNEYLTANYDDVIELTGEFNFIVEDKTETIENPFNGKSVAVTGKLIHFTRDSINAKLESLGAKPASGVTAKTNYLINNDPTSSSSKNKKANELDIPIITEDEFLNMIGE